ncbi:MAG: hypothetical protein J6S85_17375 [Methanobrevibacter sp.]|nr:hypothetical protein [Methanobrevibacter sp.]
MSEIKEKLDSLIASDYERELLLKIDDVIDVTKLPFLKKIKIGQTKQAFRILLRYDRELRDIIINKYYLPSQFIKKHLDILKPLARELHEYIMRNTGRGIRLD